MSINQQRCGSSLAQLACICSLEKDLQPLQMNDFVVKSDTWAWPTWLMDIMKAVHWCIGWCDPRRAQVIINGTGSFK